MILSKESIRKRIDRGWSEPDEGHIGIEPYPNENQFQPASLDVRLGERFIGMSEEVTDSPVTAPSIAIPPGRCWLATTAERITLPNDIAAQLTGRSTLGRMFVTVHQTAGWLDPGWDGHPTLEITNLGHKERTLNAGDRVGQLVFFPLDEPTKDPYDGQYTGNDPEPAGEL